MSLVRLLTAGKSLVGLSESDGRYHVTTKRLLPKFGSAKNPFRNTVLPETAGTVAAQATSANHRADESAGPAEVPTLVAPAVRAVSVARGETGKKSKLSRLMSGLRGWAAVVWERLNRLSKRTSRTAPSGIGAKPPVQTELTLDRVRPVKNDLSESDVEVVAVAPGSSAGEPDQIASGSEPLGRTRWNRVSTRLLQVMTRT